MVSLLWVPIGHTIQLITPLPSEIYVCCVEEDNNVRNVYRLEITRCYCCKSNQLYAIVGNEQVKIDLHITTVSGDEIQLGDHNYKTTSTLTWWPPIGLRLIREVKTDNQCYTVCHYKGYIYVGQVGGAIDRIDQHGRVTKAFIKLDNNVNASAAHNDRLYTLVYQGKNPSKVFVHNLSNGKLIKSWNHPYFYYQGQRITLIGNNQLAVGDWPSKQIIIYSLTDDVIRKVPCPPSLTSTNVVCMSSCGDDSVVISDYKAGKVVRMSLKDGSLLWSSDRVTNPGGIVHHPAGYVLVVSNQVDNTAISILDEKDGKLIDLLNVRSANLVIMYKYTCLYNYVINLYALS